MKKFLSRISWEAVTAVLLIAGFSFAASNLEVEDRLLFRATNPQIRVSGQASVLDLAGTTAKSIGMARPNYVTTAATQTLTASDCGAVVVSSAGSGTQIFTLPAVSNVGCMFTFIDANAGTEIAFLTPTAVTCVVSFLPAGATPVINTVTDATCNVGGIKNTGATNVVGDSVTIVSDGVGWYGVGLGTGIWALGP